MCRFALFARLRGEREGTRRETDGEGEVGVAASPHLTPALSPRGRRARIYNRFCTRAGLCEDHRAPRGMKARPPTVAMFAARKSLHDANGLVYNWFTLGSHSFT